MCEVFLLNVVRVLLFARATSVHRRRRAKTFGLGCGLVAAALGVSVGGCGRLFRSPPVVTKYRSDVVTWYTPRKSPLPGVDFAAVSVHDFERPKRGETIVAVWADFTSYASNNGAGGREPTSSVEFTFFSKMLGGLPAQHLEFDVILRPNEPGTLTMFKNRYDLDQGTLFLVSLAKGSPVVKQLKRSWSPAEVSQAALKKAATADPEINQFFKEHKPK
jgi:hypothetical protein